MFLESATISTRRLGTGPLASVSTFFPVSEFFRPYHFPPRAFCLFLTDLSPTPPARLFSVFFR